MTLREETAFNVFDLIYRTTEDQTTRELAALMMRVTDVIASDRSAENKVIKLSALIDAIAVDWAANAS